MAMPPFLDRMLEREDLDIPIIHAFQTPGTFCGRVAHLGSTTVQAITSLLDHLGADARQRTFQISDWSPSQRTVSQQFYNLVQGGSTGAALVTTPVSGNSPGEYSGAAPHSSSPKAGHVPGAVELEWTAVHVGPDDPRLADYRDLRDVQLRRSLEVEHGLFLAEGEKVVRRALAWSVVVVPHDECDRLGMHVANVEALRRAVAALDTRPQYVLSDGFPVDGLGVPGLAVWKGDRVAACVAAASVLAKVTRDRIMTALDREHPAYDFKTHKGYITDVHTARLTEHGPSPVHRMCFVNVRRAAGLESASVHAGVTGHGQGEGEHE